LIVLGIDPGPARIGYGVIHKKGNAYLSVAHGLIQSKASVPMADRLLTLFDETTKLIKLFKPHLISIEELFFFKNVTTAISVAQARGVILLAAKISCTPVFEPTPLQVKQGITGYGRADKNQVARMVQMLLNLKTIPKPDDITDALAIAITGANYYRPCSPLSSSVLQKQEV